MSRSQRPRSKKPTNSSRIAQTQPNPETDFDGDDNIGGPGLKFLDTEQKGDLVKKIVIYILQNATVKTPIKRVDIVKHVLNGQTSIFSELFGYARNKLRIIYGINLIETSKPNMYLCTKAFPTKSLLFMNPEGQTRYSLLFMIISYVFMKGGKTTHSNLKEFLNSFDIHIDSEHSTFGNIKKLIDEFTKQLYLTKTVVKVESLAEEVVEYTWGERSELEFDKKELLDKVAGLLKKPAACFMEQYSKAYENEGGGGDASVDLSQEIDSDD